MKKFITSIFSITLFLFVSTLSPVYAANKLPFHLTGGKVTAISGTTLSVTNNNKSFTVNTDSNTKIIRRFGGIGTLSEISVGDHINIAGSWTDNNKTTVSATAIRDGSIQERHDTFKGTVSNTTSNGFVLSSKNRGSQTVIITSSTTIKNKSGTTITQADIKTNDQVVLDGLWDRTNTTITATKIRDLSQ